jgi:type II secretory ATPase GspE/PulE/Tfp pilus assembly ATPase PilB-like protein
MSADVSWVEPGAENAAACEWRAVFTVGPAKTCGRFLTQAAKNKDLRCAQTIGWKCRVLLRPTFRMVEMSDARQLVEDLLDQAMRRGASDLHLEPMAGGYEARMRVDGVLETVTHYDPTVGRSLVSRLMVMGQLLTYRLDVPQEGRVKIVVPSAKEAVEVRLAVIPTTHGLRAAVRMPAEMNLARRLADLNLPPRAIEGLQAFAASDAGMLIVTGPAGSGKTTTLYALLQQIVETTPGVSVIALEDPVERDLPGVTQIEVSPFGELTYEKALRSILRQDPQVLMLGEIRDAAVASLAIQAALSGHRLICTLHAGSPGSAIARLLEMGLEPYQLTSSLFGVLAQRLVRRKTTDGSYRGRVPVAEFARSSPELRKGILARADAEDLASLLRSQAGYQTLHQAAQNLAESGITDPPEIRRVLGDASPV